MSNTVQAGAPLSGATIHFLRLACLAGLLLLWWLLSPLGLSASDWQILLLAATPLAIAAMAQTLPIVAGGQGLSAGATLVLVSSVVSTMPIATPAGALWVIAMGLLVGTAVGVVNGVLIGIGGLRSTPVTLATGAAAMAFALKHIGGGPVDPPVLLQDLLYGWSVGGISVAPLVILIAVCVAGELFLAGHNGAALRARGAHPAAGARRGGLPVVLAYAAAGGGAGFGGILLAAAFGSVDAAYGAPVLIQILAAIALGGGVPGLGGGSVSGSLAGAFIVVATGNLLLPLGIQDYLSPAFDAGWLLVGLVVCAVLLHRPPGTEEQPVPAASGWLVPLLAAAVSLALLLAVDLRPQASAIAVVAAGIGVLAIAQAAMLRTGIIDLSMPALISGGAIATVSLANGSDARFAAVLPALAGLAVAIGCLHGLAAQSLGRAAIVVTLVTSGLAQAASAAMLVLLPTGYTPPVLYNLTVASLLGVPVAAWILACAGVALVVILQRARRPGSGRLHRLLPFIAGSVVSVGFGMALAGLGGSAHFSAIDSYFLPAVAAALIAGNLTSDNALALAGCLALVAIAFDTWIVALGGDYATRIFALAAALVLGEAIRAWRTRRQPVSSDAA
jgi:ribose transport system permease protein